MSWGRAKHSPPVLSLSSGLQPFQADSRRPGRNQGGIEARAICGKPVAHPPSQNLWEVPFTGSHGRDLWQGIWGQCTRGVVLQIWWDGISPHLLDWVTLTGIRTRAELNTRVTSQATIAARGRCVGWADPCPRLTILMRGGTLVGGNTFHICPLAVGRAVGCRGTAGAFTGSS